MDSPDVDGTSLADTDVLSARLSSFAFAKRLMEDCRVSCVPLDELSRFDALIGLAGAYPFSCFTRCEDPEVKAASHMTCSNSRYAHPLNTDRFTVTQACRWLVGHSHFGVLVNGLTTLVAESLLMQLLCHYKPRVLRMTKDEEAYRQSWHLVFSAAATVVNPPAYHCSFEAPLCRKQLLPSWFPVKCDYVCVRFPAGSQVSTSGLQFGCAPVFEESDGVLALAGLDCTLSGKAVAYLPGVPEIVCFKPARVRRANAKKKLVGSAEKVRVSTLDSVL
ncbi:MAG: hypothetical protein JSS66_06135 [Armatimonadetes bacterium]|nr:hypothetical protein [Armatimonadota bacterium]